MAEWAYCAGALWSHVVTFAGEEVGRGRRTKEEPDNGGGIVGRAPTADLK